MRTPPRWRKQRWARVAARLERSQSNTKQQEADIDPRNIEEIRRRAVRSWLEMRSKGVENTRPQTTQERSQNQEPEV